MQGVYRYRENFCAHTHNIIRRKLYLEGKETEKKKKKKEKKKRKKIV